MLFVLETCRRLCWLTISASDEKSMSALMTAVKIWGVSTRELLTTYVSILTLTGFVWHGEVENHSSRAFCAVITRRLSWQQCAKMDMPCHMPRAQPLLGNSTKCTQTRPKMPVHLFLCKCEAVLQPRAPQRLGCRFGSSAPGHRHGTFLQNVSEAVGSVVSERMDMQLSSLLQPWRHSTGWQLSSQPL